MLDGRSHGLGIVLTHDSDRDLRAIAPDDDSPGAERGEADEAAAAMVIEPA
jgi:hypothetical protein